MEVIKGPAALLYGSEAMGGVVHIVDEAFAAAGQTRQNLNLRLFSNTYGTGLDYGIKTGREKHRFVFRGGLESHADYSDGNGQRVPNTRFAMYNFKAGYLVQKNRWTSENRLLVSQNQFGFLKDTAEVAEAASEPRLSREFEEEHQSIFLTLLSSKNSLEINEKTRLKWIVGLQSNHREEVEGEEESDLDLWLLTAQ